MTADPVRGRVQDFAIQVHCEGPAIRRCAVEFLEPLAGGETPAVPDTLEFFYKRLQGKGDRAPAGGVPTPIQFANVASRRDGPWLTYGTPDGSFVRADVVRGRAWGRLSDEAVGAQPYVFVDLLLAPLMEMLKQRGLYGLHAAAVVKDGLAYLFPGNSGSGKTTLALGLVRAGFGYLADDKLLLRQDGSEVVALAFTRRFSIDPDISGRYPELGALRGLAPLPFTTKRPLDISRVYGNSFMSTCVPRVIVHLRPTFGDPGHIRQFSPTESFARLIHQTVLAADRDTAARQLRVLAALAHGTRHYLLSNGSDLYANPARLLDLLPTGSGS